MKIISLNLWHGGRIWEPLIAFLQAESPDILLLQEVFNANDLEAETRFRSMAELRAQLGFPHDLFTPTFLNTVEIGVIEEGLAIFSRFPIIEHHQSYYYGNFSLRTHDSPETYKTTPRMLQHAVVDVAGKTFNIFNTHGVWGEHGDDTPERLIMGQHIAERVAGRSRTILGGDFNVSPDTETIQYIEEHLVNVLKGASATTFNMKHKTQPGYATAVADMLFASRDLTICDKRVYDVDVSDHLPIMIDIGI